MDRITEYSWLNRQVRALAHNVFSYLLCRKTLRAGVPAFRLRMRVPSRDVLGRRLFKRGLHEPHLTRFFARYMRSAPQDVVLDVGANIGYYSLVLARIAPPRSNILAIEPDATNLRFLQDNLQQNGLSEVQTANVALARESGAAALYRYKQSNFGKHSLVPMEGMETVQVSTRTLDDIWSEYGFGDRQPTLIKIDVEGGEHDVCIGGANTLARCPVVVSEFSAKFLQRAGIPPESHLQLFADMGFVPHEITGDGRARRRSLQQVPEGSREVAWIRESALQSDWARELTA